MAIEDIATGKKRHWREIVDDNGMKGGRVKSTLFTGLISYDSCHGVNNKIDLFRLFLSFALALTPLPPPPPPLPPLCPAVLVLAYLELVSPCDHVSVNKSDKYLYK